MDRVTILKLIFVVIVLMLGIYLVYPIISGILGGLIFSYAFFPVYNYIYSKLKRRGLSAALTTLFISAPFLVTILYGFYKAIEQLNYVTQILKKENSNPISKSCQIIGCLYRILESWIFFTLWLFLKLYYTGIHRVRWRKTHRK